MIRSIEGIRGIAAVMVALFHAYVFNAWGGFPARIDVLRNAWLFVDLFFVVSGFVMVSNYSDRLNSGRALSAYMIRRFFRLYPLHVVTTITALLAVVAIQSAKLLAAKFGVSLGGAAPFSTPFFDPLILGLEVLLLHGVGIIPPHGIHNYPSWSISLEFWMYLVFALLFFAVRSRAARIAASVVIVAGCVAWFLHLWSGLAPAAMTLDVRGFGRGLLSFFQGVLVYYLWTALQPTLERLGEAALSLLQIVALVVSLWAIGAQPELGAWQLAIPTTFAALVFLLLPDRGLLGRVLLTRPSQWLGQYSYSIYLCHITMMIVFDWPGRAVPEPYKHLVGLAYLGSLFAMAWVTYRYVEVPWRDRGKVIAARVEQGDAPLRGTHVRTV